MTQLEADEVLISLDDATAVATRCLEEAGLPSEFAALAADVLVEAEARGQKTHGLMRVPIECDRQRGKPWSAPELETRSGIAATVDGKGIVGYAVAARYLDHLSTSATSSGMSALAIRNIGHSGPLGHLVRRLACKGLIGIATGHCMPLMAYPGTDFASLGTNPIALGFPLSTQHESGNSQEAAFVTDLSTAAMTRGELLLRKRSGEQFENEIGLDAEGDPTSDPDAIAALLPMAGGKGASLALAIQALSIAAGGAGIPPAGKHYALLLIAIRPDLFVDGPHYEAHLNLMLDRLGIAQTDNHQDGPRLPGSKGDRHFLAATRDGLRVSRDLWEQLAGLSKG